MNKAKFLLVDHGSEEWRQAVALREDVLRKPLGSRFSDEELAVEKDHLHICGYNGTDLIATAVLVPEADQLKMQRVAVKPSLTNRGIGSEMMVYCENLALKQGFTTIYCHARNTAVRFYLRHNFESDGDYFDEDGIPHLRMSKLLRNA